ncbi:hypothetical protein [Pontibacter sp. G13]|nr:hypothetical protein [Pontibacter sp. G13]WNJ20042.1 hypothetical protein RJD25_06120 [Pontibacter sp. G13]
MYAIAFESLIWSVIMSASVIMSVAVALRVREENKEEHPKR